MSMNRDDYAAKGKMLFDNFADDIVENLIIFAVGLTLGFLLKWTGWIF